MLKACPPWDKGVAMHHRSAARELLLLVLLAGLLLWSIPAAQAVPKCFGKPATIVGTTGRDDIEGTGKPDVIVGLQGDDTIVGFGGNDRICGGAGTDWMNGKAGHDKISGGQRYDVLHGRAGNDLLDGGPGNDYVNGDSGDDVLIAGPGDDDITLGGGTDVASANDGDDLVEAGSGNDSIDGGSGLDLYRSYLPGPLNVDLPAGTIAGPSRIHTVVAIEQVQGTGESDTFLGDGADNLFMPLSGDDSVDGGSGRDLVTFVWAADLDSGDPLGVNVDLAAGTATGEGSDTLAGIEDVFGSEGEDVLRGDDGPNHLTGYVSGDTFEGRGGDDVLDGGYIDPIYDVDVADGGAHLNGDTCIGIEQATNCEFMQA
jgi:Ca2+-binding RTX toxin-like protein